MDPYWMPAPRRRYDDQVVEIVVDLQDGSVVSAWITQVNE